MQNSSLPYVPCDSIEEQAYRLASISLSEMESVKLMDRTDTKFLLPRRRIPALLHALLKNYRILEVDGHRLSAYETLYFDTPDLRSYHDHQCGRLNRYKVRQRHYIQSKLLFTEVKHKTNKGRTIKQRIRGHVVHAPEKVPTRLAELDDVSRLFVHQLTAHRLPDLHPVLWVGYQRITLVSCTSVERITLDLGLSFQAGERTKDFANLAIAEVKQDSRQHSEFISLMKRNGVRSGSLSKYCLGMVSLHGAIKQNRFKPQLHHLQKILQQ